MLHHEINRFCLYISFFSSISPGNFFFLHKILNFAVRQFLHETRNPGKKFTSTVQLDIAIDRRLIIAEVK